MRKTISVLFASLLAVSTGVVLSSISGADDGPGAVRTIVIMPATFSHVFEESLTVQVERDRITDYIESVRVVPGRPLGLDDERAFYRQHGTDLANDPTFRALLHDFDRAVSRHRGERGRSLKAMLDGHVRMTVQQLRAADVEIEAEDRLSGMVFVDGDAYSVRDIRALVPASAVELVDGLQLGAAW